MNLHAYMLYLKAWIPLAVVYFFIVFFTLKYIIIIKNIKKIKIFK
jgi:hypothetical protein